MKGFHLMRWNSSLIHNGVAQNVEVDSGVPEKLSVSYITLWLCKIDYNNPDTQYQWYTAECRQDSPDIGRES